MNHGPKFQAVRICPYPDTTFELTPQLMRDIKADVSKMQARGNFGDGKSSSQFTVHSAD